ncbi:hypothetical protein TorRG33x02_156060 [Trema orientale]|uniref:Uncharacterized protein n=1 Tax=Trema orientale TaxID=63057 RepID=A0A2P5ESM4_TREOI|nr:hypothetical protein TorRG33x02_156060 [Trema orientale]
MLGGRRPMGHVHSTREKESYASGAHKRSKDFKRVTRDTVFDFGILQLGFKHIAKLVSKLKFFHLIAFSGARKKRSLKRKERQC